MEAITSSAAATGSATCTSARCSPSRLISPAAYKTDPTFRTFLDQVPFGIPLRATEPLGGGGAARTFPRHRR